MLGYLKDLLATSTDAIPAHVAVGGKMPRECLILEADEAGIVLRWTSLPETYLFPWARIEAIVLKTA